MKRDIVLRARTIVALGLLAAAAAWALPAWLDPGLAIDATALLGLCS